MTEQFSGQLVAPVVQETRSRSTEWLVPGLDLLTNSLDRIPSHHTAGVSAAAAVLQDTKRSGLYDFVAVSFFVLPEVVAVVFQRGRDSLHVWTVVTCLADASRDAIYDLELALMDRFADSRFDFYVVGADGRAIDEVLDKTQACVIRRDDAVN